MWHVCTVMNRNSMLMSFWHSIHQIMFLKVPITMTFVTISNIAQTKKITFGG